MPKKGKGFKRGGVGSGFGRAADDGEDSEQTCEDPRWWAACVVCCLLIAALVIGIWALVLASPALWTQDKDSTILSGEGDVEIRNGSNLIVHGDILHGNHTMLQKIDFSPVFPIGPDGYDFVFGDQAVPYARVQADFAIGFRLGENSFLSPNNFLFGEDGLKFLISSLGVHVNSILVPFFGVFTPSDERIKTNITDMDTTQALHNVLALQPKTYKYTEEWYEALGESTEEERGEARRGFIAQEVETILPHSVRKMSMSLDGELVDDFRDLRKEDIVTEVVGAIQVIHYNRIIETAFNTLMFESLQSQIDQNKIRPVWTDAIKECVQVGGDPGYQAGCICNFIAEFCPVNIGHQICQATHPLQIQCSV